MPQQRAFDPQTLAQLLQQWISDSVEGNDYTMNVLFKPQHESATTDEVTIQCNARNGELTVQTDSFNTTYGGGRGNVSHTFYAKEYQENEQAVMSRLSSEISVPLYEEQRDVLNLAQFV